MNEEKKVQYRYFFLSFSMAFLLLSLLFFLLLTLARPGVSPSASAVSGDVEATAYLPSRQEALSVLFVGVAPDSGDADTFILARFDPARGSVPIVVFPRETAVVNNGETETLEQVYRYGGADYTRTALSGALGIPIVVFPRETAVVNNGETETLEQVYRYGGADYTRTALSGALGIPIDRFVRMDTASFIIAANTVGTVEFELRDELILARDGSAPLTLGAGTHLLDGKTAADIIHYSGYSGGEVTRCAVIGDLTAAIVNQRMDIALSTMVDKVFEKIINLIDTDISYPDYDNRKEAAAFLAKLGQDPAVSIRTEGSYSADGELYHLSDTFIALLTQTYV